MSSAEVNIKEIDLTTRVPSFPGVYGAIVIDAPRGSLEPTLVTSEDQLMNRYTETGDLRIGYSTEFYSALAYLQKSNKLWVIRPDTGAKYAGAVLKRGNPAPQPITGLVDPAQYEWQADDIMLVTSSDPGAWGNQLGIFIDDYSHKEPGSARIVVQQYGVEKESTVFSLVTTHRDGYQRNIYCETAGSRSSYIRMYDNPYSLDTALPTLGQRNNGIPVFTKLGGGSNGNAVTTGARMRCMDKFNGRDTYPVTLFLDGGHSVPAYQQQLLSICETRKDSVALLSVPYGVEAQADYLNSIVNYVKNDLNTSNSFGAIYSPHVKIYDKYTDRDVWVSTEGYVGAVVSATAANQELWYPPAGFRRGQILVQDVLRRFTKSEMDYLYDNNINPIRFAPGKGIVVWGQKTLMKRPSSLDRLNVRLLLIVVEPAIAEALEDFIFEINDEATRLQVEVMITNYMDSIKARRGVYDFLVKCNEENNTPEVIDSNRMVVHLFLKPTKSAEFIDFYVVLTPTGMSFALAQDITGGI